MAEICLARCSLNSRNQLRFEGGYISCANIHNATCRYRDHVRIDMTHSLLFRDWPDLVNLELIDMFPCDVDVKYYEAFILEGSDHHLESLYIRPYVGTHAAAGFDPTSSSLLSHKGSLCTKREKGSANTSRETRGRWLILHHLSGTLSCGDRISFAFVWMKALPTKVGSKPSGAEITKDRGRTDLLVGKSILYETT